MGRLWHHLQMFKSRYHTWSTFTIILFTFINMGFAVWQNTSSDLKQIWILLDGAQNMLSASVSRVITRGSLYARVAERRSLTWDTVSPQYIVGGRNSKTTSTGDFSCPLSPSTACGLVRAWTSNEFKVVRGHGLRAIWSIVSAIGYRIHEGNGTSP